MYIWILKEPDLGLPRGSTLLGGPVGGQSTDSIESGLITKFFSKLIATSIFLMFQEYEPPGLCLTP